MKTIKEMKENWDKTTQSADKKPEKYTDKDGKTRIRMVPVKKEETNEKTLTPAEKKKREEIAKAMERDNPGMDMKKKMAIATATAKRVAEGAEILEAQDPEMEKVKQLVRLGLMDKKDMAKIIRALTLMKDGKAVPQKERAILFDMLGELIGMITGDDAMFNKARRAVKEEKDMNGMCCKHCGDEFGKPKSESCMYDAYNPEGKNWIKKESYTEAKDPGEYDNEGAMAKTQLKGILTDAEHMIKMFSDDQNLPEWVQNKITKAADYLNSAHRYMMNDDDAQTNEAVVQRPLHKGAIVKGKFNGKVISGKIVDTPIVQNKSGVTVHWKSGQKGNFPNDHFDTKGHHKSMSEEVELDEKKGDLHLYNNEVDARKKAKEVSGKVIKGTGKSTGKWAVKEEVEEAVGTSAKYAGKSGMFGGKYTSKDRMMDMPLDKLNKIRTKRQAQNKAAHDKQDPKMSKMGYAKHMLDTDKADAKALKRGIDPKGKYDKYKKRNNIKDSVQVDEVLDTPQAMKSYKDKAKSGLNRAKNSALASTVRGDKPGFDKAVRDMDNRKGGLKRADNKAVNKTFKMLRKEETVSEAGPRHTMTTMRNRFGPSVDSKKFGVYKDHMKKHNLDEPTVRMAHQNPDNPESKKMMKNPKYAKGLELYKASIREEKGEWKTDTGWKKPEPERKDQFGNVIKTKNLAKRLAKMAAKKSAESPKNESATNMRNMKLINKIKKSGTVKSGSMAKDEK